MTSTSENISSGHTSLRRRVLIVGASVFVLSVLAGIAMMFWREYGSSLTHMPAHAAFDLTVQATLGPPYIGLTMLSPITVPVVAVIAFMVYAGLKSRRLWPLSIAGFLLMGVYWLWLVKLIGDGAFD